MFMTRTASEGGDGVGGRVVGGERGRGGVSVSRLQDDESIPSDIPVILLLVDVYTHND